jgi:hypothetical protein
LALSDDKSWFAWVPLIAAVGFFDKFTDVGADID